MSGNDNEYEFKRNGGLETVEFMADSIGYGAKVEIQGSPVCDLSSLYGRFVGLLVCGL